MSLNHPRGQWVNIITCILISADICYGFGRFSQVFVVRKYNKGKLGFSVLYMWLIYCRCKMYKLTTKVQLTENCNIIHLSNSVVLGAFQTCSLKFISSMWVRYFVQNSTVTVLNFIQNIYTFITYVSKDMHLIHWLKCKNSQIKI